MSAKDKNDWIRTADDEFYERTNFPNGIGAVDGKHITMRKSNVSWISVNYKNFFSTVLMAVPDADCCFISVDFGACGSSSDSNVFKVSTFGKLLESNKLNIPDASVLPSDAGLSMPFVFVGDQAFALSEHVLRPYPNKRLTYMKRIYKYSMEMNQQDAQILVTSLYFRMLDMFRTL